MFPFEGAPTGGLALYFFAAARYNLGVIPASKRLRLTKCTNK